MYVWSITPFNRYDIKIRRILRKIRDIGKGIPRDYRPEGCRIPLRLNEKLKEQVTVPEYESINRRVAKYSKLLRSSRLYHHPREYIDGYFSTKEAAIKYAEKFDHECNYYKWLKIESHWLIDTEPEYEESNFETIGHYQVDKRDIWFKLNCVCDAENHRECSWETPCFKYQKQDAPDYLKVIF
jgi:hypothetical protein